LTGSPLRLNHASVLGARNRPVDMRIRAGMTSIVDRFIASTSRSGVI
jgi:hypothetical protein